MEVTKNDAILIERYFQQYPYVIEIGYVALPKDEITKLDRITIMIHLCFPSRYVAHFQIRIGLFANMFGFQTHWLFYDRISHGFSLQQWGIDAKTTRTFDLRGEKRVYLLPGDLSVFDYRLAGNPFPTISLREIEQITDNPFHRAYSTIKRLFSEIFASTDIHMTISYLIPIHPFLILVRTTASNELTYLRTTFPEHFIYYAVSDTKVLVFLMVPQNRLNEFKAFIASNGKLIDLYGYILGRPFPVFNLANLESEYNYNLNKWRNPFHRQ